jgi:hypothetical protein
MPRPGSLLAATRLPWSAGASQDLLQFDIILLIPANARLRRLTALFDDQPNYCARKNYALLKYSGRGNDESGHKCKASNVSSKAEKAASG